MMKLTINKEGKASGRGSNQGWVINGIMLKLSCKKEDEVITLFDNVEECLRRKEYLYILLKKFTRRDILKVISNFYYNIGQEYLKFHITQLTFKKGEFTKKFFVSLILYNGIHNNYEIDNLLSETDISKLFENFDTLVVETNLDCFDIEGHLKARQSFNDVLGKIAPGKIIRYCYHYYHDLFVSYVEYFCKQYTKNFKVVQLHPVLTNIFGKAYCVSEGVHSEKVRDIEIIYDELHSIVNAEFAYQRKYFPNTNLARMDMSSNSWTMYFLRGISLKGREFDFSKIKCKTFAYEIKFWLKESKLKDKSYFEGDNSSFNLICESVNFLFQNNKIEHFSEIEVVDIISLISFLQDDYVSYKGESISIITISTIISELRQIEKFLIEYAQDKNGKEAFYPIPNENTFNEISFANLLNMGEGTEVIPEIVMDQLLLHIDDMKKEHQIVLKILDATALRAKEVFLLEESCLDGEINQLFFIPYKTISARRKARRPDRVLKYISDEVRELIEQQIDTTAALRKNYNIPYIFINDCNAESKVMPSNSAFVLAVNKLIQKYDIRDYENTLWRFTSRQMRKTVAERAIENNATPTELQSILNHAYLSTGKKYYQEMEKKKLSELNTEFYKKEFEISIGKENLNTFTEDERKFLYIDFRLGFRDVELGKCTKHMSEGTCGKITGKEFCGLCPKCATGKKYLPKWIKLRDSQGQRVDALIRTYIADGISDYENFVEYKREVYFLNSYEDVITKILKEDE